jgi:hypothetical protein
MIDLEQLEDERTEAQTDKADLFDFYHANWNKVIAELRAYQGGERRQANIARAILQQDAENVKEAYASYES